MTGPGEPAIGDDRVKNKCSHPHRSDTWFVERICLEDRDRLPSDTLDQQRVGNSRRLVEATVEMHRPDQRLDYITGIRPHQSPQAIGEDALEIRVCDDLRRGLGVAVESMASDGDGEVGDRVTEVLERPEGSLPRPCRGAKELSVPEPVTDLAFHRVHAAILAEHATAPRWAPT